MYRHLGERRVYRPRRSRDEGTTILLPLDLPWPADDDPGWSDPEPICRHAVRVPGPAPRPLGRPAPPPRPRGRPDPKARVRKHR